MLIDRQIVTKLAFIDGVVSVSSRATPGTEVETIRVEKIGLKSRLEILAGHDAGRRNVDDMIREAEKARRDGKAKIICSSLGGLHRGIKVRTETPVDIRLPRVRVKVGAVQFACNTFPEVDTLLGIVILLV